MSELSLDNPHDINNRPSRLPRWAQWVGVGVLCAGLVLGVVLLVTEHWRRATFMLGVCMLWVAVLRVLCDSRVVGLIAVRSKRFDVLFSGMLGAALVGLSVSIDALGS